MPNYPNWTCAQITSTTQCSPEFINDILNQTKAIIIDFYRAKGSRSTLKDYFRQTLTSLGYIKSGVIKHNHLADVYEDQHHKRFHGDSHIREDPIPVVTESFYYGLIASSMAAKLETVEVSANSGFVKSSSYVGDGVSRYISLGFQPKYVTIMREYKTGIYGAYIEALHLATHAFLSINASVASVRRHHLRPIASSILHLTATGFRVRSSCIINGVSYTFVAYGTKY